MLNIALVTCRRLPALADDDHLLRAELERRGARVTAAIWDDPAVDWRAFDRVVLRSTWDYHTNIERFLAWVAAVPARLWNSREIVRWNAHKSYLVELAARGVNVVPTFTSAADMPRLSDARYVIKPAVSATAYRTVLVKGADLESTLATFDCDVLVQPYIAEIERGEWSLVFFRGEYSHAVFKRPKSGDFRVQSDFGGSVTAMAPPPALIDDARAILAGIDDTLYARVDGLEIGGRLLLMEIELIEPVLFLA
ncbi:MAG TPA: hypothetical protein VN181_11720, partial [Thermoanaerobaculia bacterium]|nr:hypothetical protein [Thermoanaerobaculia bacterium]